MSRCACVRRETEESNVIVELEIDGTGRGAPKPGGENAAGADGVAGMPAAGMTGGGGPLTGMFGTTTPSEPGAMGNEKALIDG